MKPKNIVLILVFLLAAFALSLPCNGQSKKDKPLKVKVEQIEQIGDSIEVWVKWHNPHYRFGDLHFVKTFKTIPENLKVGVTIYLYPGKNENEFRVVKK